MKVIDSDGVWIQNVGDFRIPDYGRAEAEPGTDLEFYEPGVPTKVKMSAWIKGQPTLVEIEDPTSKPTTKKVKA